MINRIAAYFFLLSFASVLVAAGVSHCERTRKIRTERDALITHTTQTLDTGRNDKGEPYATVPVIELSKSTFRLVNPELDSIEQRFNTSTKRTVTFISIETERNRYLRLAGKDTVIGSDTVKYFAAKNSTYIQKGDSLIVQERSGKVNTYVVIRKGKRDKWYKIWTKRPVQASIYITDSLVSIKNAKVHTIIN